MSLFEESVSYKPFKYPFAMAAAQEHSVDMYWDVHSVELQDDIIQYNSKDGLATKDVSHEVNKYIIEKTLCVFTEMDKSVAGGYIELLKYIKNNEARCWFLTAAQREVVHQRAYALLAETFGFTDKSWVEFRDYAEMRDKIDIMNDFEQEGSDKFKAACILSRIIVSEAIGLFGAFTVMLNYKRQGKLMGFNSVNTWSLVDENFHVNNNIAFLNEIKRELTDDETARLHCFIKDIVTKFVLAEQCYIELVYKMGSQQDLPKESVLDYFRYLGELLLYRVNLAPLSSVRENPLDWMDWLISAGKHQAFFETKVTEYVHKKLEGTVNYDKYK
jgi:ribonucleotide reductase beta subunit family protein with ferritin-like domain